MQFAKAKQDNESLLRQIEELRLQNDWLRRHLFGVLSERRILAALSPAEQLWLDEQMLKPTEAAPPVSTTVKAYERAQRKRPVDFVDGDSKLKFDSTVPIQVIEVPNPAIEGLAEDEFEKIGERCTWRLAQQRGPYVILKYVQQVVKLKKSGEVSCPSVLTPTLCGRLLPTFAGHSGGVKKGPASGLAPLGLAPQGGASWFRWAFSSAREAAPPSPPAPGNSGPPGPWSPVSCSPSRLTEVLQEIPWLGLALSAVSRPSWQPWRARGSSPASRRVSASRAPDEGAGCCRRGARHREQPGVPPGCSSPESR